MESQSHTTEKNEKKSTKPFCSLLAVFLHVYVHYSSKALLMHQLFLCIFGCRGRARTISDKTRQDNQSEHVILVLVRTHTNATQWSEQERKKNESLPSRTFAQVHNIQSAYKSSWISHSIPLRMDRRLACSAHSIEINSCSSTRSSQCCAEDRYVYPSIYIYVEERVCSRSMAMTSARKNLLSLNVLRKFDMHVFAFTSFHYFTYFQIAPTPQQYTRYLSLFLCT